MTLDELRKSVSDTHTALNQAKVGLEGATAHNTKVADMWARWQLGHPNETGGPTYIDVDRRDGLTSEGVRPRIMAKPPYHESHMAELRERVATAEAAYAKATTALETAAAAQKAAAKPSGPTGWEIRRARTIGGRRWGIGDAFPPDLVSESKLAALASAGIVNAV